MTSVTEILRFGVTGVLPWLQKSLRRKHFDTKAPFSLTFLLCRSTTNSCCASRCRNARHALLDSVSKELLMGFESHRIYNKYIKSSKLKSIKKPNRSRNFRRVFKPSMSLGFSVHIPQIGNENALLRDLCFLHRNVIIDSSPACCRLSNNPEFLRVSRMKLYSPESFIRHLQSCNSHSRKILLYKIA